MINHSRSRQPDDISAQEAYNLSLLSIIIAVIGVAALVFVLL